VRLDLNGTLTTNDLHPVIVYALRRQGDDVEAPPRYAALFGRHYLPSRRRSRLVIAVNEGAPPTPKGQRELARFPGRATVTARPGRF
jgi:hypothetical protein